MDMKKNLENFGGNSNGNEIKTIDLDIETESLHRAEEDALIKEFWGERFGLNIAPGNIADTLVDFDGEKVRLKIPSSISENNPEIKAKMEEMGTEDSVEAILALFMEWQQSKKPNELEQIRRSILRERGDTRYLDNNRDDEVVL